jgi:uncharacterized protein
MTTQEMLRKIYERYKTIAVYGLSTDPGKAAQWVPAFLQSKGYIIIPINSKADKIMDLKSYAALKDVEERIDILLVYRPSGEAVGVVREAIDRKKKKGDIYVIWLPWGIRNEEAKQLAEAEDIIFVEDKCMYHQFRKIFLQED